MKEDEVVLVNCEGTIEASVVLVYTAMMLDPPPKDKVNLRFLCSTPFVHKIFLEFLITYLEAKKAKKVNHVVLDIFVEEDNNHGRTSTDEDQEED